MNLMGRMKEMSDISETKGGGLQFSREALDKYDKLLGDDKLDASDKQHMNEAELTGNQSVEGKEKDNAEFDIEKLLDNYIEDLRKNSDCPDTIPDKAFEASELEKRSPEDNAEMREEFSDKKMQLIHEWEKENGRLWPRYDKDILSSKGNLIRKEGSYYDAHHIQPLSMGGENVASNITPLHADVHYDRQGIHSTDSAYSKLNRILEGVA